LGKIEKEVKMGSLIKTGEVVKVDPRDIIYLYRFIREYITWNLDDYLNFLNKTGKKDSYYYYATVKLNSLLMPKFKYSSLYDRIGNVKIEQADKIKYENFSNFDVYQLDPNPDGEILKVELVSVIARSNVGAVARIRGLDFVVSEAGSGVLPDVTSIEYSFSATSIHETNTDIEELQGYLRTLRWTQGKSYLKLSEHSRRNETGVGYKIRHFEEKFFLFVNFLYTLYTGSFEKNDPGHILFEPFTELLRTYGNTFEEVLSTIKEVVTLVG
jgi:hypothetical protein